MRISDWSSDVCSSDLDAAVRLVDADGNEVPDGEPGELCVRGPLVMRGYLNKPVETAEAFRGGWLHTGDVAFRLQDGFLRLVDRAKHMVITEGFNVHPPPVEDRNSVAEGKRGSVRVVFVVWR